MNDPYLNAGLKLKQRIHIVFGKLSPILIEEILCTTDYFCPYISVAITVHDDRPYRDFEQFLLKYYAANMLEIAHSSSTFTATLSVAQIAELSQKVWVQRIKPYDFTPVFSLATNAQDDCSTWESLMRIASPEEVNDIIVLNRRQLEIALEAQEQEQALSKGTPWQNSERSSDNENKARNDLAVSDEALRLSQSGKPPILVPGDDQIPLDFGVGFSGNWRTNSHVVHWNNSSVLPFCPKVIGTHNYSRHDFPISKGRSHASATIVNSVTGKKYALQTRIGLLGCLQDEFRDHREYAGAKQPKVLILYEPTWQLGTTKRTTFRRIIAFCYGRVAFVQGVWLERSDGSVYALMDISDGPNNTTPKITASSSEAHSEPQWIKSQSGASLLYTAREEAMHHAGFALCELPPFVACCVGDNYRLDCSSKQCSMPSIPLMLYSAEQTHSPHVTIACSQHGKSYLLNKPKMHATALEAYKKAKEIFQQYPFKLDYQVLVAPNSEPGTELTPDKWWLLVRPQHYPEYVCWVLASGTASAKLCIPKSILRLGV